MREFKDEPLRVILDHLAREMERGQTIQIAVPDPDLAPARYPGEPSPAGRVRPLRLWTDAADRLGLHLRMPQPGGPGRIHLTFTRLDPSATWVARGEGAPGKYGPNSAFARASKLEEPDFVLDLRDALQRAGLPNDAAVLSLGVNTGDELELVLEACPTATCWGVDHDEEALVVARARFGDAHTFVAADLGTLPALPRFDLVLCIDTLQSPGVDDRALLRHTVQHLLKPDASLILGLPNCRYVDHTLVHGARMVNFRQPELSLLVKGLAFYKKYLQQHHRKVFITGKHELLLTAIPARRTTPSGSDQPG